MRPNRVLASANLWLLLAAAAASLSCSAAGQTQASCQASCEELQALPLWQWSEERSESEVYTFPWGARYAYQPLDYVALSKEVCTCLEQSQGGVPRAWYCELGFPNSWNNPTKPYLASAQTVVPSWLDAAISCCCRQCCCVQLAGPPPPPMPPPAASLSCGTVHSLSWTGSPTASWVGGQRAPLGSAVWLARPNANGWGQSHPSIHCSLARRRPHLLHPAGFNHPQLVRYAAAGGPAQLAYLDGLLDHAEALGLRVIRTWAHFEGAGGAAGASERGRSSPRRHWPFVHTAQRSTAQRSTAQRSAALHSAALHSAAQHRAAWCKTAQRAPTSTKPCAGYDVRQPGGSSDLFGWISLQQEPGKYNETTFQVGWCRVGGVGAEWARLECGGAGWGQSGPGRVGHSAGWPSECVIVPWGMHLSAASAAAAAPGCWAALCWSPCRCRCRCPSPCRRGWCCWPPPHCLFRCSPLQALDYVLHEASLRGMRVILSLSDFYGAFGRGQAGFEPYLQVGRLHCAASDVARLAASCQPRCKLRSPAAVLLPMTVPARLSRHAGLHWCATAVQWAAGSLNISDSSILDFYTDPRVRLLFKANLCRMANRQGAACLPACPHGCVAAGRLQAAPAPEQFPNPPWLRWGACRAAPVVSPSGLACARLPLRPPSNPLLQGEQHQRGALPG